MERVASITSSYYKFAEAAILVFSLDNTASFHVLSQHLLDIVTYAENAKIFLCGNKADLEGDTPQVTELDMENFGYVAWSSKAILSCHFFLQSIRCILFLSESRKLLLYFIDLIGIGVA